MPATRAVAPTLTTNTDVVVDAESTKSCRRAGGRCTARIGRCDLAVRCGVVSDVGESRLRTVLDAVPVPVPVGVMVPAASLAFVSRLTVCVPPMHAPGSFRGRRDATLPLPVMVSENRLPQDSRWLPT